MDLMDLWIGGKVEEWKSGKVEKCNNGIDIPVLAKWEM